MVGRTPSVRRLSWLLGRGFHAHRRPFRRPGGLPRTGALPARERHAPGPGHRGQPRRQLLPLRRSGRRRRPFAQLPHQRRRPAAQRTDPLPVFTERCAQAQGPQGRDLSLDPRHRRLRRYATIADLAAGRPGRPEHGQSARAPSPAPELRLLDSRGRGRCLPHRHGVLRAPGILRGFPLRRRSARAGYPERRPPERAQGLPRVRRGLRDGHAVPR